MEAYVKVCRDILAQISTAGVKETLQKYFRYPDENNLLFVFCVKLRALVLTGQCKGYPEVIDTLEILRKYKSNPDLIRTAADNITDSLLELCRTEQLQDYRTVSVEYVNSKLMYCANQTVDDIMFRNDFIFDKHNTCTVPIQILKMFGDEQQSEEAKASFYDRVKVLKKIASVASTMETPLGYVSIDRRGERLKTSTQIENGITYLTIN